MWSTNEIPINSPNSCILAVVWISDVDGVRFPYIRCPAHRRGTACHSGCNSGNPFPASTASTLVSVKLGQKDYATAQNILGNVVTLNFIIGIGFGILTLLFLDPILYFFGASPDTISYARDYMVIILLGNVITHMYLGLNALLRASGHPQKAMIGHHHHSNYQYHPWPYFYLSIPLGYSGSCHCHHSGSNHRTGVAIQNLHKQERIAPSPPRHLQTARYNCKKHHRYRYVSVPDESGSMLHCNFH